MSPYGHRKRVILLRQGQILSNPGNLQYRLIGGSRPRVTLLGRKLTLLRLPDAPVVSSALYAAFVSGSHDGKTSPNRFACGIIVPAVDARLACPQH